MDMFIFDGIFISSVELVKNCGYQWKPLWGLFRYDMVIRAEFSTDFCLPPFIQKDYLELSHNAISSE